jgi:signal transduction histidine kinase
MLLEKHKKILLHPVSLVILIGVFCFALLFAIKSWLLVTISEEWEIIEGEKNQKLVTEILNDIKRFQDDIKNSSANILKDKVFIEISKNDNTQSNYFTYLKNKQKDSNYEIIDTNKNCIAWIGRRNYIQKQEHYNFLGKDTSFVLSGAIYSYYIRIDKIFISDTLKGYLTCNKILNTNYELNNRYIKNEGFETELRDKYDVQIRFYLKSEPIKKEGFLLEAIKNIDQKQIGILEISGFQKDSYIGKVNNIFNLVIFSLLFILVFILSIHYKNFYIKDVTLLKTFIFSIHIWVIRYLFIIPDYFRVLTNSDIFGKNLYSYPANISLVNSLGDVLITLVFITINLLYIFFVIYKPQQSNSKKRYSHYSFLILSCVMFIVSIFLFETAINSLVFESALKLFDYKSILPSLPVSIVYICIVLISFSIIGIGIIFFSYLLRTDYKDYKAYFKLWAFILLLLISLCVKFLYNYNLNNSINIILFLLIPFLFSLYIVNRISNKHKVINFNIIFLLLICSTLISFYQFNKTIEAKQQNEIEKKAVELVRPVDDYITYLMNKMMSELYYDESLIPLISSFDPLSNYDEAFSRWLKSPLSQEKYNSAFIMFNRDGNVISQFSVGILDNDIRNFAYNIKNINQSMISLYQIGNSTLEHYVGIEPIFAKPIFTKSEKLGTIVIVIASDENIFLRNDDPDYLKTYSTDDRYVDMQNIVISEFYNSHLVTSTNTVFSKQQLLPDTVINYFTQNRATANGIWIDEIINNVKFKSYYISNKSHNERIYSLSLESLDFRWHLYNFFKIILVNGIFVTFILALIIAFMLINRRYIFLNFRTKILLALLSISLIPTLFLWFYTEFFIQNQNERNMIRTLSNNIDVISNNILRHFNGIIDSVGLVDNFSLSDAKNIFENSGHDFSLYLKDSLIVSSRPEIFKTELVSRYISSEAYYKLFLLGNSFYYETAKIGYFPYLVGYVPITNSVGKVIGVLSVPIIYKDSLMELELAQSLAFIFGGYILIFFIIFIFGYYISKLISTPIKVLTDATKKIIAGNLDINIPVKGKDEINELVKSFNKMTYELKESQKELAKAEREAGWKEIMRKVAHEIKNPLTPMKLSIQHLRKLAFDKAENFNEIFDRVTKTLLEQIDTIAKIASGFSVFAKMPERKIEKCDIHEVLLQAINLFQEEKLIDFEVSFCDINKKIDGDSDELRRVFINIIKNGLQAVHEKKILNGKISVVTEYDGKYVIIKITDNGKGIPEDLIDKVFELNFSTKQDGMGIGLNIARKTIRDFGGDIKIESLINEGTTVKIII